ncbi:MAG: molybdenum cofactor biosynthesis protein MoaE [Frankiaceae bacterium]|jgi:molybdopterin synthase catalytic subunit|nr:molybdenum cofactor biosynthesis protein MoaE [Frankiaceae bacterium]
MGLVIAEVTELPLDIDAHLQAVRTEAGGADVFFAGIVRNHDGGRSVTNIEYLAYPSAPQVLRETAAGIAARPEVLAVAVSHRVGGLAVGDAALVAAVSCAHRGAAFVACADLVDAIKAALPVWKRQVFADGSDEWVGAA